MKLLPYLLAMGSLTLFFGCATTDEEEAAPDLTEAALSTAACPASPTELWKTCADRTFVPTPAACALAAVKSGREIFWWSGAGIPAVDAPNILGFGTDIDSWLRNHPETRQSDHAGVARLFVDPPDWDACLNMRWVLCGVAGVLPNQSKGHAGGDSKWFVVTPPSRLDDAEWENSPNATRNEYCTLNLACSNASDLFAITTPETTFTCKPKQGFSMSP